MTKTIIVDMKTIEKMRYFYSSSMVNTPPHAMFSAKCNGVTITVYNSKKVLFQGENALYESSIWSKQEVEETQSLGYYANCIGSDEVGKGDYFGPLIVCATYVDESTIKFCENLNIKDSKKITDSEILNLGKILSKKVTFSLLKIDNMLYNNLWKQGLNVNEVLAKTHNKAILNLIKKINLSPIAIIDEFASLKNFKKYLINDHIYENIKLETKAEGKYLAVAISSILARYQFLNDIKEMSHVIGKKVPLGASAKVDQFAAELLTNMSEDEFKNYVKYSFKTTDKVKLIIKEKNNVN